MVYQRNLPGDKCNMCKTLYYTSPCLMQIDEEWTSDTACCHSGCGNYACENFIIVRC